MRTSIYRRLSTELLTREAVYLIVVCQQLILGGRMTHIRSGEAPVPDFEDVVLRDENVRTLDVAVQDHVLVHVVNAVQQLLHEAFDV